MLPGQGSNLPVLLHPQHVAVSETGVTIIFDRALADSQAHQMGIMTFAKIANLSVDGSHGAELGIPFDHLDQVFFG